MEKIYSYLALGDSYTIGEGVPLYKSFPYQAVQMLRKKGLNFSAPEIIAKTGWTTQELQIALNEWDPLISYDFVSLLIGVNNQYRGLSINDYGREFNLLLSMAIQLAGKNPAKVFILSIPDYGQTPFAQKLNPETITNEINQFNQVNKRISQQSNVHYLDITNSSRLAATDATLIASDGLHPSENELNKWATKLSDYIYNILKKP